MPRIASGKPVGALFRARCPKPSSALGGLPTGGEWGVDFGAPIPLTALFLSVKHHSNDGGYRDHHRNDGNERQHVAQRHLVYSDASGFTPFNFCVIEQPKRASHQCLLPPAADITA